MTINIPDGEKHLFFNYVTNEVTILGNTGKPNEAGLNLGETITIDQFKYLTEKCGLYKFALDHSNDPSRATEQTWKARAAAWKIGKDNKEHHVFVKTYLKKYPGVGNW